VTFLNQPIPDEPVGGPFEGFRRHAGVGWLFAGVWLFFLGKPLGVILQDQNMAERTLGAAALILFGAGYMGFFGWARYRNRLGLKQPLAVRLSYVVTLLVLTALMVPSAGESSLTTLVYVEALGMMVLSLRAGAILGAALLAVTEILLHTVPGWHDDSTYGFSIVLGGLAVFGLRRAILRSIELAAARQEFAELAVQEERNRFARDLHDILGHSLTVITVKAELAGRLIAANPERAATEVADVEQLARAALADVRAAVAGYRELSLAGELVAARAALQAAEIRADLPTVVDEVPEENRELFAWVVREGVTNVVRHSGARRCTIRLSARQIEVLDDGKGPTPGGGASGHGLIGLRERADKVGASVTVGTAPNGGFRLTVRVSS
jgi:two-component system sensor histidine kinase DesK